MKKSFVFCITLNMLLPTIVLGKKKSAEKFYSDPKVLAMTVVYAGLSNRDDGVVDNLYFNGFLLCREELVNLRQKNSAFIGKNPDDINGMILYWEYNETYRKVYTVGVVLTYERRLKFFIVKVLEPPAFNPTLYSIISILEVPEETFPGYILEGIRVMMTENNSENSQ